MKVVRWLVVSTTLVLLLWSPVARGDSRPEHRFAIIVGSNVGLSQTKVLRSAESDAEGIRNLLRAFGDIRDSDTFWLQKSEDKTPEALAAAFAEVGKRIADHPEDPSLLFFFFSGHGDENSIHLPGAAVSIEDLRRKLVDTGAKVRISILDSCRTVYQDKGETEPRVPTPTVVADPYGTLELRSASKGEKAAELPWLGGVFSFVLRSALGGQADLNGDKTITLNELYQFMKTRWPDTLQGLRALIQQTPDGKKEVYGGERVTLTRLGSADAAIQVEGPGNYAVYVVQSATEHLVSLAVGEIRGKDSRPIRFPSNRVQVVYRGPDGDGRLRSAYLDLSHGGVRRLRMRDFATTASTEGLLHNPTPFELAQNVGVESSFRSIETSAITTDTRLSYAPTVTEYSADLRCSAGTLNSDKLQGSTLALAVAGTAGVHFDLSSRVYLAFGMGPEGRMATQDYRRSDGVAGSRTFFEGGLRLAVRAGFSLGDNLRALFELTEGNLLRQEEGSSSHALHFVAGASVGLGYMLGPGLRPTDPRARDRLVAVARP